MSDKEVFSNQEEDNGKPRAMSEREQQIREAFGSIRKAPGEALSKHEEARLHGIREAVISGNRDLAHEHLANTKKESSWLYEELMKHPMISSIMRELSIMGF